MSTAASPSYKSPQNSAETSTTPPMDAQALGILNPRSAVPTVLEEHAHLQGLPALTRDTRTAVRRLGRYLADIDYKDASQLPRTYEIIEALEAMPDDAEGDDDHLNLLPLFEHFSRLGMTPRSIAHRLGLEEIQIRELIAFVPEVRLAFRGGAARGEAIAAGLVSERIDGGDRAAAMFWLKYKGVPSAETRFLDLE